MEPLTAIITGAGSGIGRATAEAFLNAGWSVILVGRREAPLQEVAVRAPDRCHVMPCDLSRPEEAVELAKKIEARRLPIRALINNAGIFERSSFLETTDEVWERQLATNLLAPARLSRLITPLLAANGGGSIVHVSSTLGLKPAPTTAAYSAAKAALNNLTALMAQELAPLKIRVKCVCPGIVDTPIHDFHGGKTQQAREMIQSLGAMQPAGRIGRPEEVAAGILYFCQPLSEWTTGAVLSIDGGINLV